MEFSKKIFIGVTIGVVLVTLFTCYMVWLTQNLAPLTYLIPSLFAELATATGFYYNKAREENKIKIGKENNKDLGC
jgi:predicted tellurium resistance membrane protein TerC